MHVMLEILGLAQRIFSLKKDGVSCVRSFGTFTRSFQMSG